MNMGQGQTNHKRHGVMQNRVRESVEEGETDFERVCISPTRLWDTHFDVQTLSLLRMRCKSL
jgi:hypothetical protein